MIRWFSCCRENVQKTTFISLNGAEQVVYYTILLRVTLINNMTLQNKFFECSSTFGGPILTLVISFNAFDNRTV